MSTRFTVRMPDDGRSIAVAIDEGAGPTAFWLGGFRSDMAGTKATALSEWGRRTGRRVVRFDYSGHGASGGRFADGRIGRWLAEARAVLAEHAKGEVILVGSSMGGWLALLMARERALAGRLKGLVLVAPAADFTERLLLPSLTASQRTELAAAGTLRLADADGGPPVVLSGAFFDDGRRFSVLDGPIRIGAPVHILQGREDETVPYAHAQALVERLADDDVTLTLVRDGDHRLSRAEDIARLIAAVEGITAG